MKLLCKLGLHKPMFSNVWNEGHYFTACKRCGITMIRKPHGRWKPVPDNLRVVWRERTGDDIVWPTHVLND